MRDDPITALHVDPDEGGLAASAGDWLTVFRRYAVAVGLVTLTQWLLVPPLALWWAKNSRAGMLGSGNGKRTA